MGSRLKVAVSGGRRHSTCRCRPCRTFAVLCERACDLGIEGPCATAAGRVSVPRPTGYLQHGSGSRRLFAPLGVFGGVGLFRIFEIRGWRWHPLNTPHRFAEFMGLSRASLLVGRWRSVGRHAWLDHAGVRLGRRRLHDERLEARAAARSQHLRSNADAVRPSLLTPWMHTNQCCPNVRSPAPAGSEVESSS
jgi:hypothetical protein